MTRNRSIGEMAEQCGLSVRALRHLEAKGLITPRRSEAGRRFYGEREARLIMKIVLLRQAGYRLAEISTAMLTPDLDSRSLIDNQILHLSARYRQIDQMLRRLRHTRTLLEKRPASDVDTLCSLIKEAQTIMNNHDLKAVVQRYLTPGEMARWEEVAPSLFRAQEEKKGYTAQWHSLISRCEAAMARGTPPGAPLARALLDEWRILQTPMVDALGTEHWTKMARMYAEMESWQTETLKGPFSAEVYRFMSETAEIVRRGNQDRQRPYRG
ncbi:MULTISPECIES: MerR family DNA-binding transcriptional regulator [unclassified Asaia]|uniref:MerR family transcriptional regulator n=1 Tax=unclassified Asaia TaxID=2685023 RepID=UPI0013155710|nr:MerR family DNA-binding transcriptional regulator [Asaia sp. W19]